MDKISDNQNPTLKEYLETRLNLLTESIKSSEERFQERFKEVDLRYEQRFESQQMAISKSETATERRLEGVNEFRKTLSDQTASLMTRAEAMALFSGLTEKMGVLVKVIDRGEGQKEGSRERLRDTSSALGVWIAIATTIISIVALFVRFSR